MNCRVCGKSNEPFMTFGKMPIANGFIKKGEEGKEHFFELKTSILLRMFYISNL